MSVVLLTYSEQLAEVQVAITAVLSSQKYELGGRSLTRADLEYLTAREKHIQSNLDKFGDVLPNRTARTGRSFGVSFG